MQIIRRDERTGAPTLLFRVHVDRGLPWDMAQGFLKQSLLPLSPAAPAAMDAAMADAGGEGQAQGLSGPGPGDPGRSKQKLKIRLGNKLLMAVDGKPSGGAFADDTTQHAPPQSSSADAMSDSVPSSSSPSPSPASDMLIDPASHLQQMECQTRLDSLKMAVDTAPSQKDTGINTLPQTSKSVQQPSSEAPNDIHPSADTATAPISQAQQSPAFHLLGASDTAHLHDPTSHSFHSNLGNLGSGSALGAVVADAPQAAPGSSPADENATGPPSVSGYYRPARGAVRGVLLALETQGKGQVAVYRPATGPAARPMRLTELQDK